MKNKIGILILSIILVSSIFALQSIYVKRSPESENQGNLLVTTADRPEGLNNVEMQTRNEKPTQIADYDIVIGQKLADSLLQKCSIFSGRIQKMEEGENRQSVLVNFHVDEWIAGKKLDNGNDPTFTLRSSTSRKVSPDENELVNVSLEVGRPLIVGYCSEEKLYRLVVSEEKYFGSIRDVIKYAATEDTENNLSKSIDLLKAQSDFVLAGYLTQHIWRTGSIGDVNRNATVLAYLLGPNAYPEKKLGEVRDYLENLLSKDNDLKFATRDKVTKTLVELGAGADQANAEQAILLLIDLSKKEKFDFKPHLNAQNSKKLSQNYRSLVTAKIPPADRKNFEKQLLRN